MIDPLLGGNMPPVQVFEIKPTVRMPRRWQPWKFISVAMVIPLLLMHATQVHQPTLSKQVAPPMLRKASLPPVLHFVPMHEANWPKWREKIFYKVWFGIQCSQWRSILMLGRPWWVDSSWHEGDANPFRLLDVPSKCSRGDIGSALGTIINRTWCNKALIVLLSEFFSPCGSIDQFRLWITATMFPAVATACGHAWPATAILDCCHAAKWTREVLDGTHGQTGLEVYELVSLVLLYTVVYICMQESRNHVLLVVSILILGDGPSTNCGWQPNHPWPFWLSII